MLIAKQRRLGWALVLIGLLWDSGASSAGGNSTTRVLFVGNSYTYYNSMPQLFEAMAEDSDPDREVETMFVGGGAATLEKHWDVGQALREIQTGEWDYVVLQEQSMLGSRNLADSKTWNRFYEYARRFDREIRASGAVTVFYLTWSSRNAREQQEYLTIAYSGIARELDARIAPVGLVWDFLRDDDDLDLYAEDGSHPSVTGSYLAAMTIFATISGVDPEGTPGSLDGYEILWGGELAAEPSRLCNLRDSDVRAIEDAVSHLVN